MPRPNKRPDIESLPSDIMVEVSSADGEKLCFAPNNTILHFFPDAKVLDHVEVLLPEDGTGDNDERLSVVFFDHSRLLGALAGTGHFTHLYHPGGIEDHPDVVEHFVSFQNGCLDIDLQNL